MGDTLRAVRVSEPLLHPLTELQSISSIFPFWPRHWQEESWESYVLSKPSLLFFFSPLQHFWLPDLGIATVQCTASARSRHRCRAGSRSWPLATPERGKARRLCRLQSWSRTLQLPGKSC